MENEKENLENKVYAALDYNAGIQDVADNLSAIFMRDFKVVVDQIDESVVIFREVGEDGPLESTVKVSFDVAQHELMFDLSPELHEEFLTSKKRHDVEAEGIMKEISGRIEDFSREIYREFDIDFLELASMFSDVQNVLINEAEEIRN